MSGVKAFNNWTLFVLIIATAVFTHLTTISMMPQQSPDHPSVLNFPPSVGVPSRTTINGVGSSSTKESTSAEKTGAVKERSSSKETTSAEKTGAVKEHSSSTKETKPAEKTGAVKERSSSTKETKPAEGAVKEHAPKKAFFATWSKERAVKPRDDNNDKLISSGKEVLSNEAASALDKKVSVEENKGVQLAPLGDSTWTGNDWSPPRGSKLYDEHMLQELFKKYNILWIGGEEIKLIHSNLMTILKGDASLIEVADLDSISTQSCETDKSLSACTPFSGVTFDFALANCHADIRDITSYRNLSQYDLVIAGFGQHEMHGQCPFVISDKHKVFIDVVRLMKALPIPVFWTTMPWLDAQIINVNLKITEVVARSKNNVSIFDYGAGMRLRQEEIVYYKHRKKLVYSIHARMAYIQMLANHLSQHFPHQ